MPLAGQLHDAVFDQGLKTQIRTASLQMPFSRIFFLLALKFRY